ncbi:MAG: hypothetical protein WCD18_26070 [Thermosynechococcaceae cyanobacterium]
MVLEFWRRGKYRDLPKVVPYGKTKITGLIRSGQWREGLHYVTDDAGDRLFNLDLIADWVANLGDPVAHQRACEHYLNSLPSNQAKNPKSNRAAA